MTAKRWFIFVIGLASLLMACSYGVDEATGTSPAAAPQTTPAASEQSLAVTTGIPATSSPVTVSPTATDSPVLSLATTTSSPEESAPSGSDLSETHYLKQKTHAQFPGAGSIDFTVSSQGQIYLVYGMANNVFVTKSADGGETFAEAVVASHEGNVFVHPLERPAIAVEPSGNIHVAWSENNYPGQIWYALSNDDGQFFGPSVPLSSEGPETVLVRLFFNPDGSPMAVWLQNSELQIARAGIDDGSFLPYQIIDDQVCECCHPHPLWFNGDLYIAYRNLVYDENDQQIRDIYMVKSSDGGAAFAEPVRVSDAPWYIAACPFSGPTLVSDGEEALYVGWMDGSRDEKGNLSQTDIWLSVSTDGGQTFSTNRRINQTDAVYNNLPSLAREDSDRLHVLWQAQNPENDVLTHAYSTDDGLTFSQPQVLVDSAGDNKRRPKNASLFVDETGVVYTSWLDGEGGYLATWQPADGGSR